MTREQILEGMQAIIGEHGEWTSHNIALPYGLFTKGPEPIGDNYRVTKFLQLTRDLLRRPFEDLRVLDLACLEGLYAIEFAQQGAQALGIEGRETNLAKARFAARALGLSTVNFQQGDVRDVSPERHGLFDVIICSGILYHLDQPDVFRFLETLRRMCTGLCIIDTRIALTPTTAASYNGIAYQGAPFLEHAAGATAEQKHSNLWASLDNDESFWFTRASLVNFLGDLGFTSVLESLFPVPYRLREDRITLVAMAGRPVLPHNRVGVGLTGQRYP